MFNINKKAWKKKNNNILFSKRYVLTDQKLDVIKKCINIHNEINKNLYHSGLTKIRGVDHYIKYIDNEKNKKSIALASTTKEKIKIKPDVYKKCNESQKKYVEKKIDKKFILKSEIWETNKELPIKPQFYNTILIDSEAVINKTPKDNLFKLHQMIDVKDVTCNLVKGLSKKTQLVEFIKLNNKVEIFETNKKNLFVTNISNEDIFYLLNSESKYTVETFIKYNLTDLNKDDWEIFYKMSRCLSLTDTTSYYKALKIQKNTEIRELLKEQIFDTIE